MSLRLLHFLCGLLASVLLGGLAQAAMRQQGLDGVECILIPAVLSALINLWFIRLLYGEEKKNGEDV